MSPPKLNTISKNILLVDDDECIATPLVRLVGTWGYNISWVSSGLQALEWLETRPKPGCVLLDIIMPEMGGWELQSLLKKSPTLSSIPIIFLSADEKLVKESLEANERFIKKPIDLEELFEMLKEVFDKYMPSYWHDIKSPLTAARLGTGLLRHELCEAGIKINEISKILEEIENKIDEAVIGIDNLRQHLEEQPDDKQK